MEDNESPLLTLCNQAVKLEQPRERDTLRHSPSARTSISLPLGLSSSRSAFSVKAKRKSGECAFLFVFVGSQPGRSTSEDDGNSVVNGYMSLNGGV